MPAHGKRRALGQHFLKDKSLCDKIARTTLDLAVRNSCRSLLEVGPGKGAITEPLLSAMPDGIESFVLAERDRALASEWRDQASKKPRVRVEEGDFLELPEDRWLTPTPLAVVSNLPYSAGTAIVTRLARHFESIPFMVLMFQAEVAQRLRAEPDTKAWGSLSIWIQNRWDVEKLWTVPPGAFAPPPDVMSEVVLLRRRATPRVAVSGDAQENLWERLLKGAFAHRRKMLRAGLRGDALLKGALERSGVDDTKRAEALSWEEWERIFRSAVNSKLA